VVSRRNVGDVLHIVTLLMGGVLFLSTSFGWGLGSCSFMEMGYLYITRFAYNFYFLLPLTDISFFSGPFSRTLLASASLALYVNEKPVWHR